MLGIYGPNVLTKEGDEGRWHRRITGRVFSERNNRLVYEEAVCQATQMLEAFNQNRNNHPTILIQRFCELLMEPTNPQCPRRNFQIRLERNCCRSSRSSTLLVWHWKRQPNMEKSYSFLSQCNKLLSSEFTSHRFSPYLDSKVTLQTSSRSGHRVPRICML